MPNTTSANNTVITLNGGVITDASDNVWTLSDGQVQVNCVVDPTTANVIKLAYVNGQVWQENADNLWWAKSSPSDDWSPPYGTPVSPLPVSANDTSATGPTETIFANDRILFANDGHVGTIFDANGNVWSVDASRHVVVNGIVDPTTANVVEIAYVNGQIWQKNTSNLWWAKSSPSDAWSPPYGTPNMPWSAGTLLTSANNTSAIGPDSVLITDAYGNYWGTNAGQVVVKGQVDPTTANVIGLAYENGQVWQENADNLWWAKSSPSDAWSPAYGTPVSPLPPIRTWLGGADEAASNLNNWSPTGTPQPGDTLEASGVVTLNVSGNDLAGDTLNIYGSPTIPTTVTINATNNAELNIGEQNSNLVLNVADTATLNLLAHQASFTTSGGTLQFVGANYLYSNSQLNSTLTGTAILYVAGTSEVSGAVGQGLTFAFGGKVNLQIDHPDQFAGNILFLPGSSEVVTFAGLTATNGELLKGILTLYNGDQQVGSFPLTRYLDRGTTSVLTLDQTSTGVVLSEDHNFLGSATATKIPLIFAS